MSEFKGTKGKWESFPQNGVPGHCCQAQVFVDGVSMSCIEPTEHEEEASANALLISKAPEMLEMLQIINECRTNFDRWSEIEQLIKEATEI